MTQRTTLAAFRRSIPLFALMLAFFACSDGGSNNNDGNIEGNSLLLNFTNDNTYTTGELRWMHPDSANLSNGTIDFWQDAKISVVEGNIFILSRRPGTLVCILPQDIGNVSKMSQKNLEADNPYEVAVIGNKGYIALYEKDYVQVFNISTCTPSEKINLTYGTDASTIKASGDTLLVTLQRLENYVVTKPGLLVRIRASTGSIIDTVQLRLSNPNSSVLNKGTLIVASSNWGAGDDGIEIVDLAKGTSEILADNAKLGGGVNDIALDEANQILYASVYADWGTSPVKPINIATKNVENDLPKIYDSFGGLVFDKAGKKLFVGDRDLTNPGLKVYDPVAKTTTIIGNQDPVLYPYSLAIVRW